MEEKKYIFSDPSPEEVSEFKKTLDESANKLSLNVNLEVIKVPVLNKLENGQVMVGFMDVAQMKLQKKIEIVETEIVSPLQTNDLAKN